MALVPLRAAVNRFGTGVMGAVLVGGPLFLIPYAHQVAKVNQMAQDALKISTEMVNTKTSLNREIQDHTLTRDLYFDTRDKLVRTRKELEDAKKIPHNLIVGFGVGMVSIATLAAIAFH